MTRRLALRAAAYAAVAAVLAATFAAYLRPGFIASFFGFMLCG